MSKLPESAPKVYIIVLNYNGWQDTIECLESVLKLQYPNFHMVVVDNASPNNSLAFIKQWADGKIQVKTSSNPVIEKLTYPTVKKPINYKVYTNDNIKHSDCSNGLTFIQSDKNEGFAAGNNLGVKFALIQEDADFVWLLNNDTVVAPDSLDKLINFHSESDKRLGIIGTKLLYYHDPTKLRAVGAKYNKWFCTTNHIGAFEEDMGQFDFSPALKPDYVVGASMLVPTAFIREAGLMDESYFLYFEELDWIIRGQSKGWEIDVCTASKVYHKEGASISAKETKSELADYYSIRNRLRFTKRFFPLALPTVYLSLFIVAYSRIRRGQVERLKIICKAIFNSK